MIFKQEPIKVPAGIRYLGQKDSGFNFSMFPDKCILDKELPGCGFTEYCINGPENMILTSPRIMLINNKADQHPNVFLVINEMERDPDVDKDLTKPSRTKQSKSNKEEEEIERLRIEEGNSRAYQKIRYELNEYINLCYVENRPMKILVTYDSYHIVKDILKEQGLMENFYTIVDEFQSILHDARFKSDTEMQFLITLNDPEVRHVMFASATPMLEEYINELDEFNGLPFFELDWASEDPTRIIKPNLDVYLMRSVGEKAGEIIQTYLDGDFEKIVVVRNGIPTEVISTQAILYVNSVNHITSLIKKKGLLPDQVLILCSNTDENASKIKRRLGKSFEIGHVPNPKKGETFPMFTFCTRTVYLGADFYSDNARSFIFSDANVDSLAVDISEDLPQILGRQRLDANPWKNSATFFYRTTADYREMTKEDFDKELERKLKTTKNLLQAYKDSKDNSVRFDLAFKYKKDAKNSNYKDDYVGVNIYYSGKTKLLIPKENKLVYVNEKRAFSIQQIDYKDRFSIFSKINNRLNLTSDINNEVSFFFNKYDQLTTIKDKLKLLCESGLSKDAEKIILAQISDSDEIKSYYTTLGPQRLHELGYNVTLIRKELGIVTFSPELLIDTIYHNFQIGNKLVLTDIKAKLVNLYSSISYDKNPKATDLLDYFEVRECLIPIVDDLGKKKRVRGYELISSKEMELRVKLDLMNKGEL